MSEEREPFGRSTGGHSFARDILASQAPAPNGGHRRSPHRDTATVASQSVVVHLLHHGRMVCGRDVRPPALWPKGHLWARLERAECISCVECQRAASELGGKR